MIGFRIVQHTCEDCGKSFAQFRKEAKLSSHILRFRASLCIDATGRGVDAPLSLPGGRGRSPPLISTLLKKGEVKRQVILKEKYVKLFFTQCKVGSTENLNVNNQFSIFGF